MLVMGVDWEQLVDFFILQNTIVTLELTHEHYTLHYTTHSVNYISLLDQTMNL